MSTIVIQTTKNGIPINALGDEPEISIVRLDTDVEVVSDDLMDDVGSNGFYKYDFAGGVEGVTYAASIDAAPSADGQTDVRFYSATFDYEITDLWNDHGLNPAVNKTITENVPQTDYDEAVAPTDAPNIDKAVIKAGAVTTINRT